MVHGPKRAPITILTDITISLLQMQELWLGPPPRGGSTFANDDERRRGWLENRDRLMSLFGSNGRRPWGFWRYEAPIDFPGIDRERSALWAARLLSDAETRQLEQKWCDEFYKSCEPDFTFCGHTGSEAHIQYLIFHDVPPDLCELWAAG